MSVRAGERVLTLLATPLNFMVMRALAERPMRLADLRQATGLPAQTTLRGHLASLGELGVVHKRPTTQMPYAVENELTDMGRELLEVADLLEGWLAQAPERAISLANGAAKGVVKAFVDGWGSTMMGDLAAQPMSLTELDRRIPELSYPALERRLASMRMAGLIEACTGEGAGTPYGVTDWARRGVLPLAAASYCESLHMRGRAAPVTERDIEAAFLLATPLVHLPAETTGVCQLEVEVDSAAARGQSGIRVRFEQGEVVACEPGLEEGPTPFAAGSAADWFEAVRD
ncbi:MAG TPA: winged helix-turn-helix transcriptional regulator, partial [Solirubrobacterales bacterium]